MRVILAQPRGFCAGVERAIEIVERALEKYGPPIYVRHEIVHNRHVVDRLRAKGLRRVAGDDFSIIWSPVKGRQSFDVKALKTAAIAAGVDVAVFETIGEATDRLDVRVRGTLSKSE